MLDQVPGSWPRSSPTAHTTRRAFPPPSPSAPRGGDHRAAAAYGRAERGGRDRTHGARHHLHSIEPRGSPDIAEHGRAAWQRASGYTKRARAEAGIGGFKQVIGDGLRSRTDRRQATEVDIAVHALNHMLKLGRLISVRVA